MEKLVRQLSFWNGWNDENEEELIKRIWLKKNSEHLKKCIAAKKSCERSFSSINGKQGSGAGERTTNSELMNRIEFKHKRGIKNGGPLPPPSVVFATAIPNNDGSNGEENTKKR